MSRPPFTRPLPDPARNRVAYVSEQVYALRRTLPDHAPSLTKGCRVRLITAGDTPGRHPDSRWRTVCPASSKTAVYYGVLASDLYRPHTKRGARQVSA